MCFGVHIEANLQSVFIEEIATTLAFVATKVMPDTDALIIKSRVEPKAYGVLDSDRFQPSSMLHSKSNQICKVYINNQIDPVTESGHELIKAYGVVDSDHFQLFFKLYSISSQIYINNQIDSVTESGHELIKAYGVVDSNHFQLFFKLYSISSRIYKIYIYNQMNPVTDSGHELIKVYGVVESNHFQLFFKLSSESSRIYKIYINNQMDPVTESRHQLMPCQCICVPDRVVNTRYYQSMVVVSNLPYIKVADSPHQEVKDQSRKKVKDPPLLVADLPHEDAPCELSQLQEADVTVEKLVLVGLKKSSLAAQPSAGMMIIRGTAVLLMPYPAMDTSSDDSIHPEFTYQYSIDELNAGTSSFVK